MALGGVEPSHKKGEQYLYFERIASDTSWRSQFYKPLPNNLEKGGAHEIYKKKIIPTFISIFDQLSC